MFIGNIIAFTGSSIPEGYLECDGSAVSRTEYSDLFDVIGTIYGSGDGSTTFNLPNLSGKVALGVSQTYSAGSTGGEESHTLLDTETPSHVHNIPQHTHANTISSKTPQLSHTVSTQPVFTYTGLGTGTGKHASGSSANYSSRTTGTMAQSTNMSIADHPATPCTVTGGILDCPAFNTETAGEGLGHNNMMPYLAVTYIIKSGLPVPVEPGMAMYNGFMVATAGGGYISGKTV